MKKPKFNLVQAPNAEQQAWLNEQFAKQTTPERVNPCVRVYGVGPEGAKCKTCVHLFRHKMTKVYLKCDLRDFTRGPGSDHKARWPACGKYQAK